MALRNEGICEEIAFKYSLNFESIEQTIQSINNKDYKDFNIWQFIDNKPEITRNVSLLQNYCNHLKNSCYSIEEINNNNNQNQIIPFKPKSFSEALKEPRNEFNCDYSHWKSSPNDLIDFSSGDQLNGSKIGPSIENQSMINRFIDNVIRRPNAEQKKQQLNESNVSVIALSDDFRSQESYSQSFNSCSKELSFLSPTKGQMNDVEKWINNELLIDSDSVSKLCSFQRPRKSSDDSDNTLTDNQSKTSISSLKSLPLKRNPTNLLKLRGVYIGNLKPNFDHKVMKNRFRTYGTIVDFYQPSKAGYAFIHFKDHKSATDMISDWQSVRVDECKDNKKLLLRFIPTQEQMQKYNSMPYSQYRKKVIENNECDYWRSGSKCKYGEECFYSHIPINKSIDTPPDPRKSKWNL
jgi:hypothetical protein